MYIPRPVKVNLKEGIVETAGGLRKMTVVFMELLDVEVMVSEDKDVLHEVRRATILLFTSRWGFYVLITQKKKAYRYCGGQRRVMYVLYAH